MSIHRMNALGAVLAMGLVLTSCALASAAAPWERWRALSDRERTFLTTVFKGDEAKAVEYAQVAGINVNSIGGEPLSVWFYRNVDLGSNSPHYRNLSVQRIVFERFKQNANPKIADETTLMYFCSSAPRADRDEGARKFHIDAMASSFESLVRYGLRDKAIINEIFGGCFFRNATGQVNEYTYDTLITKLLKAGADINYVGPPEHARPIEYAVKTLNAPAVERLVRDGAQVNFQIKAQCGMQVAPTNLNGWVLSRLDARYAESLIRIVAALARAGLPPTTKATYVTMNGYGSCVTKSPYDAAVDAGNLELAKAFKEAAASSAQSKTAASPPSATAVASVAPAQAIPAAPTNIGQWRIVNENGRLVAMANASKHRGDQLAGLRLECVSGRLEYVPVALKLDGMRSLWVNVAGDVYEMKLINGRASGASAATLSKTFLTEDKGGGDDLRLEMSVHTENGPMSEMLLGGFTKMRAYMLAACKG